VLCALDVERCTRSWRTSCKIKIPDGRSGYKRESSRKAREMLHLSPMLSCLNREVETQGAGRGGRHCREGAQRL
jgi:hypothetical protein